MKIQVALMLGLIGLGLASLLHGAESAKYPAPRFPSYLRPPKSIDDIMPFARAAVRDLPGVARGRLVPGRREAGVGFLRERGDLRGTSADYPRGEGRAKKMRSGSQND